MYINKYLSEVYPTKQFFLWLFDVSFTNFHPALYFMFHYKDSQATTANEMFNSSVVTVFEQ